jgi:hypothetical protein
MELVLAASAAVVGYATLWLVRHEVAVRRFRAGDDRVGPTDR